MNFAAELGTAVGLAQVVGEVESYEGLAEDGEVQLLVIQGTCAMSQGNHAVGHDGNALEATDGVVVADSGADERLAAAEVGNNLALPDLLQAVD